ncbi:MAG: hypothetical protein E2O84_04945, partial [Bacteroidetes bacterium]
MSKIFNGCFPAVDRNTWESLVRSRLSVDVSLDEFDWMPDGDLKIQPFKMLPEIEGDEVLRDPLPRLNPGEPSIAVGSTDDPDSFSWSNDKAPDAAVRISEILLKRFLGFGDGTKPDGGVYSWQLRGPFLVDIAALRSLRILIPRNMREAGLARLP